MQVASPPFGGAAQPEAPEPVLRRREARAALREGFDHFAAQEYSGLLAEATILLDDPARATRRLRYALTATWRDWNRIREDPTPADRVRDRIVTRLDRAPRTARTRPTSGGRPVTMTALAEIPSVQRQALVLHHVLGRTVEQIASDTGSSPIAVRQRLCHGAWALATRHPHVRALPFPRAAPRPHPDARTRVMTDLLDDWASTELEVLRETVRLELATDRDSAAGAHVRHHDQRRLAMTAAAAAVGAAGAVVLAGLSVHALTAAPTPPAPGAAPIASNASAGPGVPAAGAPGAGAPGAVVPGAGPVTVGLPGAEPAPAAPGGVPGGPGVPTGPDVPAAPGVPSVAAVPGVMPGAPAGPPASPSPAPTGLDAARAGPPPSEAAPRSATPRPARGPATASAH